MESSTLLNFVVAGQLKRNYILLPKGKHQLDVLGGGLVYAGVGAGIWSPGIGLIGRVGENFPQQWLEDIARKGFDRRGIRILPESLNQQKVFAYDEAYKVQPGNPVSRFAHEDIPYPKALLDYNDETAQIDNRIRMSAFTIRLSDIPGDYLDANCAHLCPLDYISHSLLAPIMRQGHVHTITMDPSAGYMSPVFWDDMPILLTGITAFHTSEEKITALFQGRSTELWEMAEALASYGCEVIVIKRGAQGQYLYDRASHRRWIIPAYPAHLVDPTGAGDAFCGGFLAGYQRTYDPLQAVLHGSISASLVIEGSGSFYALDSLLGLAEARMQALREMVRPA